MHQRVLYVRRLWYDCRTDRNLDNNLHCLRAMPSHQHSIDISQALEQYPSQLHDSRRMDHFLVDGNVAIHWHWRLRHGGKCLNAEHDTNSLMTRITQQTDLVACVFDTWSRETNDQIFVLLLIISAWLIPILVIFFCYLRVNSIILLLTSSIFNSIFLQIFEYTRGTRATINSHSCTEVHSSATPVSSLKIVTVTDSRKKPFFNSGKAQQEVTFLVTKN